MRLFVRKCSKCGHKSILQECTVKVILFLISIFFILPCSSAKSVRIPDEYGVGLDFSALSNTIELRRGEIYKSYFTVKNTFDSPVTFKAKIEPVTVLDGDVKFSFEVNTSETEITKWTQLLRDKEYILDPAREVEIHYIIDVPDDCKLGEQKESITLNVLTPIKDGFNMSYAYTINATVVDSPLNVTTIVGISTGVIIIIGLCILLFFQNKRKTKNRNKKR